MSFPGRPAIVPGMPFMQPPSLIPPPTISDDDDGQLHSRNNAMAAGMPSMSQPPPTSRTTYRAGPTINQRPQMYTRQPEAPPPKPAPSFEGPVITVFVGNISERAPEPMIKRILAAVGSVISWKRVSTFGFCEYDGPTAGLRAVRILHDLDVAGKKLVAKVDAKNKLLLDNYKEEETRKTGGATQEDAVHEKREDDEVVESIQSILLEYKAEIDNYEAIQEEQQQAKATKTLSNVTIEDDKRDLINREIGKFRKTAEADEAKKEKEKDRKKREETREKEKRRSASPRKDKDKKSSRRRSRSRDREREREKERASELREREREREREKEREREQRERDYREQRERDRDHRDEKVLKAPRDLQKEKEMEEEMRDRKKAEKKAREKEAAYQERLRNWELRERRRTKEYEKEKEKELNREEEREKDAKRLKEFLEDYDDERDDSKYYKGRELQRRLADRVREADLDAKDRNKEQEELEELKNKIFSGDYDNPTQEFERLKRQRDDLYKPKILIDVNLEQSQQRERELARERERDAERQKVKDRERAQKERYVLAQASRELASLNAEPIESTDSSNDASHFDNGGTDENYGSSPRSNRYNNNGATDSRDTHQNTFKMLSPRKTGSVSRDQPSSIHNDEDSRSSMRSVKSINSPNSAETPSMSAPVISLNLGANAKKKRLEVKDIFNNDEDNEDLNGPKKRKLVPLDYEDNVNQTHQKSSNAQTASGPTNASDSSVVQPTTQSSNAHNSSSKRKESIKADENLKKEESARSQEEKRRHIKSIIDKIPTGKSDLFNYKLDWSEIDNLLMEKKIRPWINKKIIEYIGEPEPTLVDFICSKVLAGSTPQGILDDVQMVLDEEAEVFVVKMWRLLIYEVEAKKVGLGK